MDVQAVTVAALYVDPRGVYANLPGVEVWDEARDARRYEGPWPVVAHPPCQRWCQLAPLNQSLHGYAIGDDGGCFLAALTAVRTYGGVLEHPALSLAWSAYGLPSPGTHGWTSAFGDDGYTTEVAQVAYGHEARKRTWLYAVGCELPALDWREPPATAQVSALGTMKGRTSGHKFACLLDAGKSNYTPAALRDVLLSTARSVTSEVRLATV